MYSTLTNGTSSMTTKKLTIHQTALEENGAYIHCYWYKQKLTKEEAVKTDPCFLRNDQETNEQ